MAAKDERAELLKAFEDLRVADVRDGMDTVGLFHTGSMSPEIRPLWRTRAFGIARTARYVKYDGPMPTQTGEEYWEWAGWYYGEVCSYPWMADIREGDLCVIDQSGLPVGLMGSANTLDGIKKGGRGYVTNGGVRDTDEIILQKVPFWSERCVHPMVQARLQFDAKDISVVVGGVTVSPGDVIVADGDGVIVVPREVALEVAGYANAEHKRDMATRRRSYEALGIPLDETVAEED
ncbi:MAG: RraA family protein [Candidatus Brocadiae bacterium]|nr:RraA family protein [Candidatus Brocadiia bacterium]